VRKFVYIDKLPSGNYSVRHWGPCPCIDHDKKEKEPFFYREGFEDFEEAKKRENVLESRLLAYKHHEPDPTLRPVELLQQYVDDPEVNNGKPFRPATKRMKLDLAPFLSSLENILKLNHVTIDRYLKSLSNPTTRYIRYGDLHAFCRWCEDQGYLASNPFEYEVNGKKKKLVKPKPNQRDIKLSLEEIQKLLNKASPAIKLRLLHVSLTGKRATEILKTEWKHLDLERRTWFIPGANSKSTIDSVVPLRPELAEAFQLAKTQLPKAEGLVHPKNNFNRDLRVLAKQAGIETKVTPHVFRHSFASHWRGSPQVLMGLLGWRSPEMIKRYTHLNAEDLRQEAETKGLAVSF
jgi:integrase